MKKISLITPFYNEEKGIPFYFESIYNVIKGMPYEFEIVCVDDGSRDLTYEKLKEFKVKNPSQIKLVKLSRNFGKEPAITAGLELATGDCVILLDADLQDPPTLVPNMVAEWEKGFAVVLMKRQKRKDGLIKKIISFSFYRLIGKLSPIKIPKDVGDFRLMDKKVVKAVNSIKEKSRFTRGIFAFVGFKTTTLPYLREKRFAGEPSYSFRKSLGQGINGILSFSFIPIRFFTYIGLIISTTSFFLGIYFIIKKYLLLIPVRGFTSTITIILFMGGIQLLSLGLIGEYVGRIFEETKNRPIYIVDEIE